MAETILKKYSVQEKLNKMDVDVITLTPDTAAEAVSDGEVIFMADAITDAVAVPGGTCILQSIGVLDDDDHGGAIDVVFMDTTGLLDAGDDGGTIDAADGAIPDAILGVVTISSYFDGNLWKFGHKENIGLVLKAASTTTSIYVSAVNRSGGALTWTAAGLRFKFGIVKD
tara:strand:+ start:1955 stop:2464 length:510 start_codon:yes stop_codon:yes gene_type:complete